MIKYRQGNLLHADAEALVNTVNCVGIMGKGIALQFKQAYPDNFKQYQRACKINEMRPGKMFIVSTNSLVNPKYIINFPTKRHWKDKSILSDIENGLDELVNQVRNLGLKSIAVPPLGCGNGGLEWHEVRQRIEKAFHELPEVDVLVYEPIGAPSPEEIIVRTEKPRLTRARALYLALMKEYSAPGYHLTLLEIQKLAYFLQEIGEPLKLNFKKALYGPYADNLNQVLIRMEGHYVRGCTGSRSKDIQIHLLPNADQEAFEFLKDDSQAKENLYKVTKIIRGFETPYGMELLATVHWVAKRELASETNVDDVVKLVHSWNPRKKKLFSEAHIKVALDHMVKLNLV